MSDVKSKTLSQSEKKPYEKPVFIEKTEMTFPEEIWEEFNGGNWCFGCSNCNCN